MCYFTGNACVKCVQENSVSRLETALRKMCKRDNTPVTPKLVCLMQIKSINLATAMCDIPLFYLQLVSMISIGDHYFRERAPTVKYSVCSRK